MNGSEYERLFNIAQEGRDAALSCVRVLEEHGHRIVRLERSVSKNNVAVGAGRFGVIVLAWVGSVLIGVGGLIVGFWDKLNGPN